MYHVNVHVSLMEENVTWIKSGITINAGVSSKIQENIICEKDCTWNPSTCSCKNNDYMTSITEDSVITWNKSW